MIFRRMKDNKQQSSGKNSKGKTNFNKQLLELSFGLHTKVRVPPFNK